MGGELQTLFGGVGDALYFHHVYVAQGPQRMARPGSFSVKGKPRRMMVLRKQWWFDLSSMDTRDVPNDPNKCHWYPIQAKPGYLVVELRSECPQGREAWYLGPYLNLLPNPEDSTPVKPGAEGDDQIQKKKRVTWIGLLPVVYPAECCAHGVTQNRTTLKQEYVDYVLKQMIPRGLGYCDHVDTQTLVHE